MNDQLQELLKNPIIQKLVSGLPDRLGEYRNQQRPYDLQIVLNRNFVEGKQWAVLLPNSNELYEPMQDEGEVRLTSNKIKPIVNVMKAEIISRRPTWKVEPYNGDTSKIEAANVATQILRQYYYEYERTGKLQQLVDAIDIDGYTYLTVDYDPDDGEVIDVEPDSGIPIKAGKITLRLVSALDVYALDNYADLNKMPAVIEIIRMNKKEVQKRWDLKDEPASLSPQEIRVGDEDENDKDRECETAIYKFWFKAGNGALPLGEGFDDGLCIVWLESSNKVLDIYPFPYPYSELNIYPYVDYHFDRRREHYHSQGIPEQLIPLQMELNRTLSQIMEAKNYIGNPMFKAAKGQFKSIDDIPTQAGGVMFYNPLPGIESPSMIQPPSIPAYINNIPSMLAVEAQQIYSTTDIAQAQQPGSVNSYSGLQLLSNIQSKVLTPYVQDYANNWSTVGKIILMMEQKYTDYEKQLKITDDVGDMQLNSFYSNADIAGDFDVIVTVATESESLAVRAQRAIQELQLGVITPEEYKARIYGETEDEDYKMDMINAQQDNRRIVQGEVIDPYKNIAFVDHKTYYNVLRKLVMSESFQNLPQDVKNSALKKLYIHQIGVQNPQMLYQLVIQPDLQKLGVVPAAPVQQPAPQQQVPQALQADKAQAMNMVATA